MANCVTAKHTGWVGGSDGGGGGGEALWQRRQKKKKDRAVECSSRMAEMLGVGSLSLLTLLGQADVTWSLTNLIMRHENAPWWQLNHLSSVRCPRRSVSVC